MVYRIAEAADWSQAQETGFFASTDLAEEGFIHASECQQILETARRYYAGKPDLLLLEIDEAALAGEGVQLKREWAASRQEYFPHIFAPIPLAAVRQTWEFAPDAAGEYQLPASLETA